MSSAAASLTLARFCGGVDRRKVLRAINGEEDELGTPDSSDVSDTATDQPCSHGKYLEEECWPCVRQEIDDYYVAIEDFEWFVSGFDRMDYEDQIVECYKDRYAKAPKKVTKKVAYEQPETDAYGDPFQESSVTVNALLYARLDEASRHERRIRNTDRAKARRARILVNFGWISGRPTDCVSWAHLSKGKDHTAKQGLIGHISIKEQCVRWDTPIFDRPPRCTLNARSIRFDLSATAECLEAELLHDERMERELQELIELLNSKPRQSDRFTIFIDRGRGMWFGGGHLISAEPDPDFWAEHEGTAEDDEPDEDHESDDDYERPECTHILLPEGIGLPSLRDCHGFNPDRDYDGMQRDAEDFVLYGFTVTNRP